jgi:hypothetical protein
MTREEAKHWLEIELKTWEDECKSKHPIKEAFSVAIEALEQEPRWIPTSERLPEEDGEYYATVYDTDENYKYMDIAELEDGIWQYKDYVKVLAWMPLPEPYREVEE